MDKKVKSGVEVLQALDDDPSLSQAVRALGQFHSATSNTADDRRNLRGELEGRALRSSRAVLKALEECEGRLGRVRGEVRQLRACCAEMEGHLSQTRAAAAGQLAVRAAELRARREDVALKLRLAERFVALFTLTPAESTALSSSEVSDAFFSALERAHVIAGHAKVLVRSPATQQCGLDVLDRMTELTDSAYDRITVYAQQQFAVFAKDSPEPGKLLCTAMRLLARERPSLLRFCLEEIEGARRQAVVGQFVRALTVGGPGGVPGPIDAAAAGEPVRYVADMLSWCHQTLASESELMEALFGRKGEWRPAVGNVMDFVCRPLRSRMEGVVKGIADLVLAHELRSLVQHYRVTLTPLVTAPPPESEQQQQQQQQQEQQPVCALLLLLGEYQDQLKALFDSLVAAAAVEARAIVSVHPDLGPPSVMHRVANQAARIAGTCDTSLLPPHERTAGALLEPLIAPQLEMCYRTAAGLSAELGLVFLLNCLVLVRDVLGPYEFAHDMTRHTVSQIEEAEARLGEAEALMILQRAGLQSVGTDDAAITSANMRSLEQQVLGAGEVVLGASDKIQDDAIRRRVRGIVCDRIVQVYTQIHARVHEPSSVFVDPQAICSYTPEQFKLLMTQ